MDEILTELLNLALKSKDLNDKIEYLTKYLALNSNDADVWKYKGEILGDLGRDKEAIECGRKWA
ncbi:MAG: hypothetical protein QW304_08940 [Thermoproteota archaeon]